MHNIFLRNKGLCIGHFFNLPRKALRVSPQKNLPKECKISIWIPLPFLRCSPFISSLHGHAAGPDHSFLLVFFSFMPSSKTLRLSGWSFGPSFGPGMQPQKMKRWRSKLLNVLLWRVMKKALSRCLSHHRDVGNKNGREITWIAARPPVPKVHEMARKIPSSKYDASFLKQFWISKNKLLQKKERNYTCWKLFWILCKLWFLH